MSRGAANKNKRKTIFNEHSSRSHTILEITLSKAGSNKGYSDAVFTFCDLAGSERFSEDQLLNKTHKLESKNINQSLSHLARVIKCLYKQSKSDQPEAILVPYRDSKLTRVLQNSLNALSMNCILTTISPREDVIEETIATLKFTKLASQIRLSALPIAVTKDSSSGSLPQISKLQEEVKYLKKILHVKSQGGGISELVYRFKTLQEENKSLRSQLIKQKDVSENSELFGTARLSSKYFLSEDSRLQANSLKQTMKTPSKGYLIPMIGGNSSRARFQPQSEEYSHSVIKSADLPKFKRKELLTSNQKLRPSIFSRAGNKLELELSDASYKNLRQETINQGTSSEVRKKFIGASAGSLDRDPNRLVNGSLSPQFLDSSRASPQGSSRHYISKWVMEDSVRPESLDNLVESELGSPVDQNREKKFKPSTELHSGTSHDGGEGQDDKVTVKNHNESSFIRKIPSNLNSPSQLREDSIMGQVRVAAIREKSETDHFNRYAVEESGFNQEQNSPSYKQLQKFRLKPRLADSAEFKQEGKKQQLLKLVGRLNRIEADISLEELPGAAGSGGWERGSQRASGQSEYYLKNNFWSEVGRPGEKQGVGGAGRERE